MRPGVQRFLVAGMIVASTLAPQTSRGASVARIERIECRQSLSAPPVTEDQASICVGYDRSRPPAEQPNPANVERYLPITVAFDAPVRVSAAIVCVSPTGSTTPRWTPFIAQTYDQGAGPVNSITVHNASSNAFPLFTKKCATSTDSTSSRNFRLYVEVRNADADGTNEWGWLSDTRSVRIAKEGIVTPPVDDSGTVCPRYPPPPP